MVHINYNQKETKRRAGCFNYFSHIIWFCGGKPDTAKKSKMKRALNYMGRESAEAFYTWSIHSPQQL